MNVTHIEAYRERKQAELSIAQSDDYWRNLIREIEEIEADAKRPRLRLLDPAPRDWKKWRRKRNAFLRQCLEDIRCQKRSVPGTSRGRG